jgi:hypothetical protein
MRADWHIDACGESSLTHGALYELLVEMMATQLRASRVYRKFVCREDVLPVPFAPGIGVLARQSKRQVDIGTAALGIFGMEAAYPAEMRVQSECCSV